MHWVRQSLRLWGQLLLRWLMLLLLLLQPQRRRLRRWLHWCCLGLLLVFLHTPLPFEPFAMSLSLLIPCVPGLVPSMFLLWEPLLLLLLLLLLLWLSLLHLPQQRLQRLLRRRGITCGITLDGQSSCPSRFSCCLLNCAPAGTCCPTTGAVTL